MIHEGCLNDKKRLLEWHVKLATAGSLSSAAEPAALALTAKDNSS
jgi:hypothetical protein